MNKLLFCFLPFLLLSCAIFKRNSSDESSSQGSAILKFKGGFKLVDKAGEFYLKKESGFKTAEKLHIAKRQVLPSDRDQSKILEQSIAISKVGSLKKLRIMRPHRSQYTVWFDGKKYMTDMSLDAKSATLRVNLTSPEPQWNGLQTFSFPDTKSVYCFYTQVIECAAITGFLNKAVSKKQGVMNFYIIWDGFPYVQEQYLNIPPGVFTKARLAYDGVNKDGERRFSLSFGGQVIFFLFDKNKSFSKKYWISQGLSMSRVD